MRHIIHAHAKKKTVTHDSKNVRSSYWLIQKAWRCNATRLDVLLLQDRRQVAPGLQEQLARWLATSFCLDVFFSQNLRKCNVLVLKACAITEVDQKYFLKNC